VIDASVNILSTNEETGAQFQPQQVKSLGSHHFYHYKLEETFGNFGKLLEAT